MEFLNDRAPRASLLNLGNFEQLAAGGAPVVQTLLEQIPLLVCLVTSRRWLGLGLPSPPRQVIRSSRTKTRFPLQFSERQRIRKRPPKIEGPGRHTQLSYRFPNWLPR